jgi:adenylosuccinate lyase
MDDLPREDSLAAVSPLDGRYARRTAPLVPYASEAALARARTRVEVEYLFALADLDATPLTLEAAERETLRDVYREFDAADARLIKRIETDGAAGFAATNHDVKAVEYFLRTRTDERLHPWLHFGLTSEDVNALARRLLVRPAVTEVLQPRFVAVRDALVDMAREHRGLPMLGRTHGQPATPTTFGKEMAVFAARLGRTTGQVTEATDGLTGKLGGATGTLAAHRVAYPEVDWPDFAASFVESLGFEPLPLTTQVHPGDDLAALFDALRGVNNVLVDLARDCWRYVSDRYLVQAAAAGETGSSTMPHKVNPIDFENAEGNLSKANADLTFLADYVTKSRLQRDLSDSTVKRNVGGALAHCLIGYTKTASGLASVAPDPDRMRADLEASPAVVTEAIQTVLRREGHPDAYERVKAATRGRRVTAESLADLLAEVDVDESVREELRALDPADYTGYAAELVDALDAADAPD